MIPAGYRFHHQGWYYKNETGEGPYMVDELGRPSQGLPFKMFTDGNGDYARIRVDAAQTNFFAGKQFRTFQKFVIPAAGSIAIRATVGVNIILYDTSLSVEGATVEMALFVGGSAAGPWTAMPVIPKNTMTVTPVITSSVTLDYDGVHTGGTMLDLIRVQAGNKSGAFGAVDQERGVGPGTYYYELNNVGNQEAVVVFSGFWEERV